MLSLSFIFEHREVSNKCTTDDNKEDDGCKVQLATVQVTLPDNLPHLDTFVVFRIFSLKHCEVEDTWKNV